MPTALRNSPKLVKLIAFVLVLLAISSAIVYGQDDDEGESSTEIDLPLTADATYTVQTGDTLDEIAAVFDVRLACLREVNDIGTDDETGIIRPGDELLIDMDCPAYDGQLEVEFPRLNSPGRSGEDGTYVVQPGDTLDTIAQAFEMSIVQLRLVNEIPDVFVLQPGQVLTIPSESDRVPYGEFPPIVDPDSEAGGGIGGGIVDGDLYVVQPGDTLDTIAQEFEMSIVQLRQVNQLDENLVLMPGTQLIIPNEEDRVPYGQFPPLIDPTFEEGGGVGGGIVDGDLYVVQPRDTLDTIAQAFEMSVVQLRQINQLDDIVVLMPGQQLLIPSEENRVPYGQFPPLIDPTFEEGGGVGGGIVDGDLYVVQPGDTLDTIAQEFEMSIVQLRQVNQLDENLVLMPGQQLLIPSEENRVPYGQFPAVLDPTFEEGGGVGGGIVDGEIYVIQPRDTLDTIGQEYNVSVVQLRELNQLGRYDDIFPGQQLLIPSEESRVPYGQFPPIINTDAEAGGGVGGGFEGEVYVLQSLETVDGVAQEYNVSTRCLLEFNGITNTRNVQPGTQIFIPTTCPPYGTVPANTTTDEDDGEG